MIQFKWLVFFSAWRTRVLLVFFYLTLSMMGDNPAHAQIYLPEPIDTRILVLHSYHNNFHWTNAIVTGIESVFAPHRTIALHHEFLEARRINFEPRKSEWAAFLSRQYDGLSFDAIITSDDRAFTFIMEYRDQLFPGLPVVFCGINPRNESRVELYQNVTGIIEAPDIVATFQLALRLFPNTQKIYTFDNNILLDIDYRNTINNAAANNVEVINIIDKTTENIRETLATLSQQDLVIFLSLPDPQSLDMTPYPVPSFTIFDTYMGHGIVGGHTINGFKQGENAAQMALQIIKGATADGIPIKHQGINSYIFDHQQLKRFDIPKSKIPEDSILINESNTFFDKYRHYFWSLFFFLLLETVLILLLIQNLLKRRQSEDALRKSDERFSLTLNAINEGLWDYNPKTGTFNYVSAKIFTMLGFEANEKPPTLDAMIQQIHPEDRIELHNALKDAHALTKPIKLQLRYRVKSGNYRWMLIRGDIVERDEKGIATRIVGTQIDITDQQNLEQQLRQSQKMESIGLLAGGIAHDFNNLLTVIIGFSDMALKKTSLDHATYKHIEEIKKAGDRASQLTNQLLAFSRKQIHSPQVVNINTILTHTHDMLQRLIGEEIAYRTHLDPDIGEIKVDPRQVDQIIMNLVINARDAMKTGGEIVIKTSNVCLTKEESQKLLHSDSTHFVLTSISDTGTGMSKETMEHMFDPFFTTKEVGKGSGLGLATVYGIVNQNKGFIQVKSEIGRGTTFEIFFPQYKKEILP
jgi:two-component system, cell cycle sensor histidine kinase and response regulator CckA